MIKGNVLQLQSPNLRRTYIVSSHVAATLEVSYLAAACSRIPHTPHPPHPQPFTPTSVAARCPRSLLRLSITMFASAMHNVARRAARPAARALHTSTSNQAKVVVALYPDPVSGYPPKYARDEIPKIDGYADGQTAPTPSAIDFKPGELLGCVSGELGLREFLESNGHTLVVTSDKCVSVW